jgi:hypothetical protein
VQVNASAPPHEYHALQPFDVVSDGDGRWSLPPLSRVAQLTLRIQEGGSSGDRTLVPTYQRGRDAVDVELS